MYNLNSNLLAKLDVKVIGCIIFIVIIFGIETMILKPKLILVIFRMELNMLVTYSQAVP